MKPTKSRPIKTAGYDFSKQAARRRNRRIEAQIRAAAGVKCAYGVRQALANAESVIAVKTLFNDAKRIFHQVSAKTYRAWERAANRQKI
jgi:hypothetical protein